MRVVLPVEVVLEGEGHTYVAPATLLDLNPNVPLSYQKTGSIPAREKKMAQCTSIEREIDCHASWPGQANARAPTGNARQPRKLSSTVRSMIQY